MGLEHVETIVANNQATVDFTNVFSDSDGADRYLIFVDNCVPATDSDRLSLRLSSDGGSTWDSGASDYAWSLYTVRENSSTTAVGSSGDDSYNEVIGGVIGNDPSNNDTAMANIVCHNPTNANKATVLRSKVSAYDNDVGGSFEAQMSGGERLTQSAVDSIQFFMSSGDIASGIFSVYRVTQSGGGAKQHIETIEANDQASVDFTGVFDPNDGYDRYMIYVDNMVLSQGAVSWIRMSSDGGSTWDSGSSDYAWSGFLSHENGGTGLGGNGGSDFIRSPYSGIGNAPSSNDTAQISAIISNPTNINKATVMRCSSSVYNSSFTAPFRSGYSGGIRLAQSAIDSIQFFTSSGNISSGTFSVYGIETP